MMVSVEVVMNVEFGQFFAHQLKMVTVNICRYNNVDCFLIVSLSDAVHYFCNFGDTFIGFMECSCLDWAEG